ncbi:MAG: hypothetical protein KME28_21665 [Pelatocladus maniniholoensis HA4357-MV3]|uniref:Uncharacterized protein n=1 Tax=Pelatocladus maniniholoensis HA4357-MV3 TaxID=1117104 RepID=A0A9E3LV37_9NOST|nr:hypothetical protein [Pelatocladus maniniholoensis HA4357-MV3]BAZ68560.1 hypothetical protein NIES4106_33240 [Fischerella sp. NIES-4106]
MVVKLTLSISPKKVALVLTIVVICLSCVSLAGQFSRYILGHGNLFGLVRLFNVGEDSNIPTWYSSITLLFCSLLLALIATSQKIARARYILHWKVLSAIFLYLSIDEVAMIHENADAILGSSINRTGFLHYGWVAVAIPLILIFVVSYLKFLAHLPRKISLLFFVAGTIFVSGAIGAEMFAGRYDELYSFENMNYAMITAVEEFCEMFGIVVFIYALLSYMNLNLTQVHFCIQKSAMQAKLRFIDNADLQR